MTPPSPLPAARTGAPSVDVAAPALELAGVSAAYGPYRALFGVSVVVPASTVVALLGPNGAGKSTVARVASGLVAPTAGHVAVDGRDVTGAPPWRVARAGLAHVPEGRAVFTSLTVEENLALAFRQRAGREGVASALERAYERFPLLGERRRQRAGTLSGGQQRLLSLAKVLVVPPRVLVADELSLGLAPGVVDEVYEGLEALHRAGTAILVVEQQLDRALSVASRAVVLEHGAVAFDGPTSGALEAVERVLTARGARTSVLAAGPTADPARGRRVRGLRPRRRCGGPDADGEVAE